MLDLRNDARRKRRSSSRLPRGQVESSSSSFPSSSTSSSLSRRQSTNSSINSNNLPAVSDPIRITYGFLDGQLAYSAPVTLPNGVPSQLLVATGAGDLWLASSGCGSDDCDSLTKYDTSSATPLRQDWNATYIDGSVRGEVFTLPSLQVGQRTWSTQAFGSVEDVEMIRFDNMNVSGSLGLSLPSSSAIQAALDSGSASSNTLLSPGNTGNVLSGLWDATSGSSNPTPRIVSLGLQRLPSDGGSRTVNSSLAIGGVDQAYLPASRYGDISFTPVVATTTGSYSHWTLFLTGLSVTDKGIVSPIAASFAGMRTSNPTVVLDSGSSLNYAPSDMLNAMYGAFIDGAGNRLGPGQNGIFYVPCDLPLNISLTLSSTLTIPIHPLDASLYQSYSSNGIGQASQGCIGSFQSLLTRDSPAGADIVLGTPFLRNVYSVFSCEGSLAGESSTDTSPTTCSDPVVGLLPLTTDLGQAYQEFSAVRVGNEQLGDNSAWGITYSAAGASSGGLNTGAKIAIGIAVAVVVIIGLFVLTLFVARKRHAARLAGGHGGGGGDRRRPRGRGRRTESRGSREGVWSGEKSREGETRRSHSGSLERDTIDGGAAYPHPHHLESGLAGGRTDSPNGTEDYDYDGRRASLSAKEQAQLREAALLHGFYDADLFSDEPPLHNSSGGHHAAAALITPRFNTKNRHNAGTGIAPGGGGGGGGGGGDGDLSQTASAFGTDSIDSRGYGEARRIQKEYLRRHPSLEMEREAQRLKAAQGVAVGAGAGGGVEIRGGGNEIEMEERRRHPLGGGGGGDGAREGGGRSAAAGAGDKAGRADDDAGSVTDH